MYGSKSGKRTENTGSERTAIDVYKRQSLTSVSSKAAGLKEYIKEKKADDEVLSNTTFNQGDIVNTIIKCSNGETILLTLDTTLPRYYSRGFTVQGLSLIHI